MTEPMLRSYDREQGEWFFLSACRWCRKVLDLRKGHYEDSLGRWEFCTECYVHKPFRGRCLAWWYAVERSREIALSNAA